MSRDGTGRVLFELRALSDGLHLVNDADRTVFRQRVADALRFTDRTTVRRCAFRAGALAVPGEHDSAVRTLANVLIDQELAGRRCAS